jgi:hypothetical protein
VQWQDLAPVSGQNENIEEDSFKRLEQFFGETLRSHAGSVLFAILPGSGPTMVHLLEAVLDKHGHPLRRHGRPQRHHVLSPERATGQHRPLRVKERGGSARGQMIARISQFEQIGLL